MRGGGEEKKKDSKIFEDRDTVRSFVRSIRGHSINCGDIRKIDPIEKSVSRVGNVRIDVF